VLAVHVEQERCDLAQLLQRHGLAVDEGARASVGTDDPSQQQLAVDLDAGGVEQRVQRRRQQLDVEARRHFGTLGAGAHLHGIGPVAGHQHQRIDDDGLAGTGLPGQHGKAAGEGKLERLDDRKVADVDVRQHGGRQRWCSPAPRPQCSFERSRRK
jgi:hypothetical protein